jgi:methylmalonyl-CoA/ethylmalonyl-CoA epimerase
MIIDHIGIVVPSLTEAMERWESFFEYKRNSDVILNTRQKVRVAFLSKQDSLTIKLVEPVSPESPVFQAAQKGGGLHHLCFRCSALQTEIPVLQKKGANLIVAPQPGEAFNNHSIAFLLVGRNLNIELIDTWEKKGWSFKDQEECAELDAVLP